MRIAVIADTHLPASIAALDELGSEVGAALSGVDLILHAGDIVAPSVLDWCEQFAPVRCAFGGHDHFDDPRGATVQYIDAEGWRLGMVHDIEAVPPSIRSADALAEHVYGDAALDVLIAGDSHYERIEYREGRLLLDPGSPVFPHHQHTRLGSIALIEATTRSLRVELVVLGETPGVPNPCTPVTARVERSASGATRLTSLTIDGVEQDPEGAAPGWHPRHAPPLVRG